jgi:hypothetical protein
MDLKSLGPCAEKVAGPILGFKPDVMFAIVAWTPKFAEPEAGF